MPLADASFGVTGACIGPFLPHGSPHRAPPPQLTEDVGPREGEECYPQRHWPPHRTVGPADPPSETPSCDLCGPAFVRPGHDVPSHFPGGKTEAW